MVYHGSGAITLGVEFGFALRRGGEVELLEPEAQVNAVEQS